MTIWQYPARVVRVVDGDTIRLNIDMGMDSWKHNIPCRLAGINCPEMDTVEGRAARQFVVDLVESQVRQGEVQQVTFTSTGLDKWRRPLGVVRLADGRILNDLLLTAGHAVPMKD